MHYLAECRLALFIVPGIPYLPEPYSFTLRLFNDKQREQVRIFIYILLDPDTGVIYSDMCLPTRRVFMRKYVSYHIVCGC